MARTRRTRWSFTVPLVALVMSVGVLGSTGTSAAVDSDPVVSFFDSTTAGTRWLHTGAPDGTGATPLTPADYHAWNLDVTPDGSAYVVGLGHPDLVGSVWDRSQGLVLVRRVDGVTTTTLLANVWDDAVITSDGTTVLWLADGVLWRWRDGEIQIASLGGWKPPTGWRVVEMALASDDSTIAVSYEPVSGTGGRILAGDAGLVTAMPYVLTTSSTRRPSYGQMFWSDWWTLMFAWTDGSTSTWYSAMPSDNGGSVAQLTEPAASALAGVYAVRAIGGPLGVVWGWRDVGDVTQYTVVRQVSEFATSTWTSRVDGPTSTSYVPSAAAPPPMTTPVNRPSTHPYLYLSATTATYGRKLVYSSWAEYLVDNPWLSLSADGDTVERGMLQKSVNAGSTWSDVGWTSWAKPVPWPPDTRYDANGYTPVLTRNTWFRWKYPGDLLTRSSTSAVRKVTVIPLITVSKVRSASTVKVYGTVTRTGGTVQLWRSSGSSWTKLASVPVSSVGRYSFGYRSLRAGSYKVVVPATTSWGAATKKFTI